MEVKHCALRSEFETAKRCRDYDSECVDVEDKCACFRGGAFMAKDGSIFETDLADGYCPFLIGMRTK